MLSLSILDSDGLALTYARLDTATSALIGAIEGMGGGTLVSGGKTYTVRRGKVECSPI